MTPPVGVACYHALRLIARGCGIFLKGVLHIENIDYFAVKDGGKLLPVWRDTKVQKTDDGIQRTRTIERNKRTFIVHSIHPSAKETPTGKLLELAIQEAEDCHK